MVARAREHNESYEDYRKALKWEAVAEKVKKRYPKWHIRNPETPPNPNWQLPVRRAW